MGSRGRSWRPAIALAALLASSSSAAATAPSANLETDRRGDEYFAWTRQARGGDYNCHPDLVAYVRLTGERLVAAAGMHPADFHFAVVNQSAANAWATPAANIALSRGLLLLLENEAELAAVLAHEIAHAQLQHFHRGDKQAGGHPTRGSADLELAADARGVEIMAQAGYRARAALDSLLRLQPAPGDDGPASQHQLSPERLAALRQRASRTRSQGQLLAGAFEQRLHLLRADAEAYRDHDRALARLQANDPDGAHAPMLRALQEQPGEYLFHMLAGDYWQAKGDTERAAAAWTKAIELQPDYYRPWLLRGWSESLSGDINAAADLRTSHRLLPTDQSAYALGALALAQGEDVAAAEYFRAAAGNDSTWAKRAGASLARLEIVEAPARHIAASLIQGKDDRLYLELTNHAPVTVTALEVEVRYFARGHWRVLRRLEVEARLEPAARYRLDDPVAAMPANQLQRLAVRLVKAHVVDN